MRVRSCVRVCGACLSHGVRGHSKGIGALSSILGTDEEDRIGLVEGALLRRVDCSPHYERDSLYLVFPPSHSYLITSAPGWIRLKNCSGDSSDADGHHVELLSWRRKGERPLGRFTLAPGQEEVFDFRVGPSPHEVLCSLLMVVMM